MAGSMGIANEIPSEPILIYDSICVTICNIRKYIKDMSKLRHKNKIKSEIRQNFIY